MVRETHDRSDAVLEGRCLRARGLQGAGRPPLVSVLCAVSPPGEVVKAPIDVGDEPNAEPEPCRRPVSSAWIQGGTVIADGTETAYRRSSARQAPRRRPRKQRWTYGRRGQEKETRRPYVRGTDRTPGVQGRMCERDRTSGESRRRSPGYPRGRGPSRAPEPRAKDRRLSDHTHEPKKMGKHDD